MHDLSVILNITYDSNEKNRFTTLIFINDINLKRSYLQQTDRIHSFTVLKTFEQNLSTGNQLMVFIFIDTAVYLF